MYSCEDSFFHKATNKDLTYKYWKVIKCLKTRITLVLQ